MGTELSTLKQSTAAGVSERKSLVTVFDLGLMPLANDFCKDGAERQGYAPLKVMFCPVCGLAQLSVVVNPNVLYGHYHYVTGRSDTVMRHIERLTKDIVSESPNGKTVLEIGSNDGTYLEYLKSFDYIVEGIDPADNLCSIVRQKKLTAHTGLFGTGVRNRLWLTKESYDIIIARHVFCHIDDWRGFIRGLEEVSNTNTLVCIEAPYALDTLERCEWDQIYFEHLSYLSVKPLDYLFKGTKFRLHKILRYPIHGGSIVVMLRRVDSGIEPDPSVDYFRSKEYITADSWVTLDAIHKKQVSHLVALVKESVDYGKTVVGYGASAKSTMWMNACKFTRKDVKWVCDNTPQKQYTFGPGTEIPIVDDGALTRELPDYAILWAWNFADEIIAKEKIFRSKGGKWIVPVPDIKVI